MRRIYPAVVIPLFLASGIFFVPAEAFEATDMASCEVEPLSCAVGVPTGVDRDVQGKIQQKRFERLKSQIVLFGTNRAIVPAKKSNVLYKISDRFSDIISSDLLFGYVEQAYNSSTNKIVVATAKVEIFQNEYDLLGFYKKRIDDEKGRIVTFVHGVNNDFESSIRSAGKISRAGADEGRIPLLFSWPSRLWGVPQKSDYYRDVNRNEESIPSLEKMMQALARIGKLPVDWVAHSRGVYLTLRYLDRIDWNSAQADNIRNMALAAPDVSHPVFRDLTRKFSKIANKIRVFVYVSQNDYVISASENIGSVENVRNNIDLLVDNFIYTEVSDTGTVLGHDYYIQNLDVLSDIFNMIGDSESPFHDGPAEGLSKNLPRGLHRIK